jgi:hypothetical protein
MSEATRRQRAFLRYLYEDDPAKLASELKSMERHVDADTERSEWWETSDYAKIDRLLAMEARRLAKQTAEETAFREAPFPTVAEHQRGLTAVLVGLARGSDASDVREALRFIPHAPAYRDAWLTTARRLREHFPYLDFAAGKDEALQDFLTAKPNQIGFLQTGASLPDQTPRVVRTWQAWKEIVEQEPRRAPVGHPTADEDLRQAKNLWKSWLAYTEVLNEDYPQVLDAVLLDLGVLAQRGKEKDNQGRPVLVRQRSAERRVKDWILVLTDDAINVECETVEEAIYQVLHWYDYLVENGRLAKLPPLPAPPTPEQARLDPVLTVRALAAKVSKRIERALGILKRDYVSHAIAPRVQMYRTELAKIALPSLSAPGSVRARAAYEAWGQCGLLEPLQYVITVPKLEELRARMGTKFVERAVGQLASAMNFISYGTAWQVAPEVFLYQAEDEAAFYEDIRELDGYLTRHQFEVIPSEEQQRLIGETRLLSLPAEIQIPYHIVRGENLAACEAALARETLHLPPAWRRLRPGATLVGDDGVEWVVG